MKEKAKPQPLIITTKHKGVFFGYGIPNDGDTIRLEKARMCVYWSSDMKGLFGLASKGPSKSCKIGPEVPAITLREVTSAIEVSPAAVELWNSEPWNS